MRVRIIVLAVRAALEQYAAATAQRRRAAFMRAWNKTEEGS